jgi:hypothetical protein
MMMVVPLLSWLSQGGPYHLKHQHWRWHPIAVVLVHYVVTAIVSIVFHDLLLRLAGLTPLPLSSPTTTTCAVTQQEQPPLFRLPLLSTTVVAHGLIVYATWLLLWRTVVVAGRRTDTSCKQGSGSHQQQQSKNTTSVTAAAAVAAALYEYCWLCNVTLWMGALALYTHRPVLATAYCVTVGIDQLLWYVDILGYFLTGGRFVVGVAKYLIWPGNGHWTTRITCTHHLWTIPVLLGAVRGRMHSATLPLSAIVMTTNVLLSRWMIPETIIYSCGNKATASSSSSSSTEEEEEKASAASRNDASAATIPQPPPECTTGTTAATTSTVTTKYLNVNLSYALWKDIQFDLLQINYDDPPAVLYLFRLLWRWQGFNTIIFALLHALCYLVFSEELQVCE